MRMSRVLTGGAVIAAAVAAGTAFTNTNTLEADTVAGYGTETVSGATVLNTAYNPDGTDPSLLASIVFTAEGDLTDTASTLQLTSTGTSTGAVSTCTPGLFDNTTPPGETEITCTFGTMPAIASFDGIALTVVSQ
jgi:hypothetical protein